MIILNMNSHNYISARERLERTKLLFRQELYPDDFVGLTAEGLILENMSDLEEHMENIGGGFGDDF